MKLVKNFFAQSLQLSNKQFPNLFAQKIVYIMSIQTKKNV